MLRSLLNSEVTNTNGAINPCHSPSQNPATGAFAPGAPFIMLGPGTQPANIASNNKTRMSAANFMIGSPTSCCVRRGASHSQARLSLRNCRSHRLAAIGAAHVIGADDAPAVATKWFQRVTTLLTVAKIGSYWGTALGTRLQQRLAQQEVRDKAQGLGNEDHQQRPQQRVHAAAPGVGVHIANQKDDDADDDATEYADQHQERHRGYVSFIVRQEHQQADLHEGERQN